jgi:hypothetical protein
VAVNYFAGKSQQWLETEYDKVLSELSSGKVRTAVNSGEVGSQSMIESDLTTRRDRLYYALFLLDPATYPVTNFRVSRTKAVMYQS